MKVIAILFVSVAVALPAQAGIYKCVVEGKTTFSQRPCGDSSESVEVKYEPAPESGLSGDESEDGASEDVSVYIATRRANRELSQLQRKKRRLVSERDRKIKFWYAETQGTGATASTGAYALGQAQAVRAEYNESIGEIGRRIEELKEEILAIKGE